MCSGVYIIVFPGNGRPARDTHVSGGRGRDLNWSFPPNSEMFCIYILGPGNMCLKYKNGRNTTAHKETVSRYLCVYYYFFLIGIIINYVVIIVTNFVYV